MSKRKTSSETLSPEDALHLTADDIQKLIQRYEKAEPEKKAAILKKIGGLRDIFRHQLDAVLGKGEWPEWVFEATNALSRLFKKPDIASPARISGTRLRRARAIMANKDRTLEHD